MIFYVPYHCLATIVSCFVVSTVHMHKTKHIKVARQTDMNAQTFITVTSVIT